MVTKAESYRAVFQRADAIRFSPANTEFRCMNLAGLATADYMGREMRPVRIPSVVTSGPVRTAAEFLCKDLYKAQQILTQLPVSRAATLLMNVNGLDLYYGSSKADWGTGVSNFQRFIFQHWNSNEALARILSSEIVPGRMVTGVYYNAIKYGQNNDPQGFENVLNRMLPQKAASVLEDLYGRDSMEARALADKIDEGILRFLPDDVRDAILNSVLPDRYSYDGACV